MVYVLYGSQYELIKEKIEEITKTQQNKIKYNFEETNMEEIINDAVTVNMFEDKKVIIVENSKFLSNSKEDITKLEEYLKHPFEKTILIFTLTQEKLDERTKIVKLLRKDFEVLEFNILNNNSLEDKIIKDLKNENYNIKIEAVKELILRTNSDYTFIKNELEKLKLYKLEDKNINLEDVEKVVSVTPLNDIFKLMDLVVKNNKKELIKVYQEMIDLGEDPIKIIVMLSNEFRLVYEVKLLKDKCSDLELSKVLKVHPFRIKLAKEKGLNYSALALEDILLQLSNLDFEIKSGLCDKYVSLEMFLLSFS